MAIKLVVTDVDGVMTDGSILIDDHGVETKTFHVLDGSGIANLRRVGIATAIITGRRSRALTWRARELQISELHQGKRDKLSVLLDMSERLGIGTDEMVYVGDDLLDLKPLMAVALPCCPADARPEVLDICQLVTTARGGHGVLREVADHVIKAEGLWDQLMANYLPDGVGDSDDDSQ